jgi:hypothetical protein
MSAGRLSTAHWCTPARDAANLRQALRDAIAATWKSLRT